MNDSHADRTETARRPVQGGPPLALLAVICLVLLIAGLAVGAALGGVMPPPYGSATAIQDYVSNNHTAAQAIAVGAFASSIPLAIYAATASARLRQLGITAPGATIALAGGLLASAGLGLSGLLAWTLSRVMAWASLVVAGPLRTLAPTRPRLRGTRGPGAPRSGSGWRSDNPAGDMG